MPKIKCPYCRDDVKYETIQDVPTFPFCSKRCKMIDLGVWLDEGYSIATPLDPLITESDILPE